jgi:hypothetical protein
MLKFYARHGRFPDSDGDLPGEVVEFVARQVQVPPEQMPGYEFAGRTVEYYRAQIRGHFGFRECTVEDAQALQAWLAENVAEADPRQEVGVPTTSLRNPTSLSSSWGGRTVASDPCGWLSGWRRADSQSNRRPAGLTGLALVARRRPRTFGVT